MAVKTKSERLFEATKFAFAHILLEGAAPLQTSPSQRQQQKQNLPVEGGGGLSS